jgi:beta-N-acetylhexosaminidase
LRELEAGGCLGCVKHFPGLGASEVDSHEELPTVKISRDELFDVDLFPYKKMFRDADVRAVMVGHAAFANIDLQENDANGNLLPSSLSLNFVTKLLRAELEFDGLVLTDDLEMGAIVKNYGIGEACKLAIKAGEDMLLICAGSESAREGFASVLAAVKGGEISETRIENSLQRIFDLKNRMKRPLEFNENRLRELSEQVALLKEKVNS